MAAAMERTFSRVTVEMIMTCWAVLKLWQHETPGFIMLHTDTGRDCLLISH